MNRLAVAVVLAVTVTGVSAQDSPQTPKIVDVTWREVLDHQGHRSSVPVMVRRESPIDPATARGSFAIQSAILRVDEQWREAKLANDVETMKRIISDDFFETNQNGNGRDKAQMLQLWTTFKIQSLATHRATIRVSGNVASVTGEQTEVNDSGTDRMLFARVYVQSSSAEWKLLSSTQFRRP